MSRLRQIAVKPTVALASSALLLSSLFTLRLLYFISGPEFSLALRKDGDCEREYSGTDAWRWFSFLTGTAMIMKTILSIWLNAEQFIVVSCLL
jgi:hypothetical protein